MYRAYDVVVVGSGIAGLSFAIKVAESGKRVAIVTKKNSAESNTNYAQGGIAAVTAKTDDVEAHVSDTLNAGDGLCDESVVREILADGSASIEELAQRGVTFTQLDDGRVSLGKEGGHSRRRILHVKDVTGKAIEEALLQSVAESDRIDMFEHYFAIELITESKLSGDSAGKADDRILGIYALDTQSGFVETFAAHSVLLATGGIGQVYQYTTNPFIATGDGIAMAYRAKAEIKDMEFIQFHPTALYNPGEYPAFLISEAVRGFGAKLRDYNGNFFMHKYDEREELAPRDIVARTIDYEMKRLGADHLYLDISHREKDFIISHFYLMMEKLFSKVKDTQQKQVVIMESLHS